MQLVVDLEAYSFSHVIQQAGARVAHHQGRVFVFDEVVQEVGVADLKFNTFVEFSDCSDVQLRNVMREVTLDVVDVQIRLDKFFTLR